MSFSSTLEHTTADLSESLINTFRQASRVVVLTGPELSVESGLPAFQDGSASLSVRYYADDMTDQEALRSNRGRLWGWYEWRRAEMMRAAPNAAHQAIAAMETIYQRVSVITQSVDNLHKRAGSRDVLHLNGQLARARCHRCGQAHEHAAEAPRARHANCDIPPPACRLCEGPIRPDVVWFGEEPSEKDWIQALRRIEQCDLLLNVGIATPRYPTAELAHIASVRGTPVVQITPDPTVLDRLANVNIRGEAGDALSAVLSALQSD